MNIDILLDLALVVICIVVAQLALGVWYIARARHYRGVALTERIRLQVGDARCRLVNAAARGELKPTTATFQQLYLTQTSLMRGTDQYPALSAALWAKVLRFEKRRTSTLAKEAKQWTPEVRSIVEQTADAIRQVWILYMPCGTMLRVMKHLLVGLGFVSYAAIERFCDRLLLLMVSAAETLTRAITLVTFDLLSAFSLGKDVRLVHEMREAERILRSAVEVRAKAPKAA